jgi:uncharacterized integral membrane protein
MPDYVERPGDPRTADQRPAAVPSQPAADLAAPRRAAAPPVPPPAPVRKGSMSRAAWVALVIGVVVAVFMLIFILQNNVPTELNFLAWSFTAPVGVALLFAGIAGALITAMVGTIRMIVLGHNLKKLERQQVAQA